jgi:SAM-dependent methyltransferase
MRPPSDYKSSTTDYYDTHAAEFCENTVAVDVSALYGPFLRELPTGGRILDAGCDFGRDSLAFLRRGYLVVSIDASREMVAATTKHTGQEALLLTFDVLDFDSEFDGLGVRFAGAYRTSRIEFRLDTILKGAQAKWRRLSVLQIWRLGEDGG